MVAKINKKDKIESKSLPLEAVSILKRCSEKQLEFMASFAGKLEFDTFIEVTRLLIENNMQAVFSYPEDDPQKLSIFKANSRGQVGGITMLLYVIKGANSEIERRTKKKQ